MLCGGAAADRKTPLKNSGNGGGAASADARKRAKAKGRGEAMRSAEPKRAVQLERGVFLLHEPPRQPH
jgi:hypothetical protein